MSLTIKLLIIEDNYDDFLLFKRTLSKLTSLKFDIQLAKTLRKGLQSLTKDEFDVIFLDLGLPDSQGMVTLKRVYSQVQDLPILILTGLDNEEMAIEAVGRGAQDYIIKGRIDARLLNSAIRYAIVRNSLLIELKKANHKILEQQKKIVEEERLKALLHVTGVTTLELSQPVMTIIKDIEILKKNIKESDINHALLDGIIQSGEDINGIVQRIHAAPINAKKMADMATNIPLNPDKSIRILSVEDSDFDFNFVKGLLRNEENFEIIQAKTIKDAVDILKNEVFNIILLDYSLPDGTGISLLRKLKNIGIEIPVVVITGGGDEIIATKIIQEGADGYLVKGMYRKDELLQRIKDAIEKFQIKNEMSMIQKKLAEMSVRDELTDLFNRRYLKQVLEMEFNRAKRYDMDFSCLMIDLDFFKKVNDTLGHAFGDVVLKNTGVILKEITRESDLIFRYGGEEFVIFLTNTNTEGARITAEKIRMAIEETTHELNGQSTKVTTSIGISSLFHNPEEPHELMDYADKALYAAKADGRNRVVVYRKP